MPTRNVNLTEQMDRFVDGKIQSGEYANASEVMRAGLRALKQMEQEDRQKLAILRAAVRAGEESGLYEGDIVADLESRMARRAP
jgi:antitoxin ParD1/3/4